MNKYSNQYAPFLDEVIDQAHVLIAGATGSGKSVLLDNIVCCLLDHYEPSELQLCLIDPKKVGLSKYRDTVQCARYADELGDAISILNDCIDLITERYQFVKEHNDIGNGIYSGCYNGAQVYIVIDELADLMVTGKKEVLPRLQRIAQLGRACRVHLIAATQAPSRKIIPAELTLNFTCRIALRCDSSIESRQVIKVDGAECLPEFGYAMVKLPSKKEIATVDVPYLENDFILGLIKRNYKSRAEQTEPECDEDEQEAETISDHPFHDCQTAKPSRALYSQAKRNAEIKSARKRMRDEYRHAQRMARLSRPRSSYDVGGFILGWFKIGLKIAFWTLILAIIL